MLVARAVELLGLTSDATVLDLFCGLGNFSLALARRAARCVGIEGEAVLVGRARHNAARNDLANTEFHVADLSQPPARELSWMRGPYSHVLLDPPRTGAREVLGALAILAPQRVLYISCHPGSLARDLGLLVHSHGFTLEAAGVVDMFPHTAHVESLALLRGTGAAGAFAP
jgi:23S rRNA (uracil1939-C5)-methyltransferase